MGSVVLFSPRMMQECGDHIMINCKPHELKDTTHPTMQAAYLIMNTKLGST